MKEFARALARTESASTASLPGAVPGGVQAQCDDREPRVAHPAGRFGKPDDVAAMAVAVLSERFGRYVAGAEIVVDGGLALYNWIDART
jgi:NAD(P)-dependent dehydrogenase (short-subunit alcohol dehydrogenase family)